MKHLSISMKLMVGFGVVLALLLASIGTSISGMARVGAQVELYGQYTLPNSTSLWSMRRDLVSVQRYLLRALHAQDIQAMQENLDLAQQDGLALLGALDAYGENQRNADWDGQIGQLQSTVAQAASVRREIGGLALTQAAENLRRAHDLFNREYIPLFDHAAEILVGLSDAENERAAQQRADARAAEDMAWALLIACAAVSTALTAAVVIAIRKSILTPVKEIAAVYTEVSKGNKRVNVTYESRDELGRMAALIRAVNEQESSLIGDLIEKLTSISQGDLQIRVDREYPGDFTPLRRVMETTVAALNHTMHAINIAAEQVSTGALQVSGGAQALAAGSAEQAASVEELTAAIGKIAEQAAENAASVDLVTQYVGQAGLGVSAGNEHMRQLTEAMADISSASNQISNITKVIEDIAFQTNILALNAAIEAARAGSAGKGFAVVAEEVRSLAAKSAEAARQTADLIRNSVATVSKGAQITAQTAQILQDMGDSALRVTESFSKIEQVSAEQSLAIEQIRQGLTQVSAVIQTNAATAEENSATSEELSAQAVALREETAKFQLDVGLERSRL